MEKIRKRTAQKLDLRKVLEVTEKIEGMNVTLKMISSDYRLEWYKKRIRNFAKDLGMGVIFSNFEQTAIIYCRSMEEAYLLKMLFSNEN